MIPRCGSHVDRSTWEPHRGSSVVWQGRHLLDEYEEVLKRNASELGLSLADVDELLNAVCARAEEWTLSPDWQPVLADPDDEPLM